MVDHEVNRSASDLISNNRDSLAGSVTDRVFQLRPDLAQRYGPDGRRHCLTDTLYHLAYLTESLATGNPEMFLRYVAWARLMLEKRGIQTDELILSLGAVDLALDRIAPREIASVTHTYLAAGLSALNSTSSEVEEVPSEGRSSALAHSYLAALLSTDRSAAISTILDAADAGVSVKDLYLDVLQMAQHQVGRLWQANEISVAQEHYCSAVTQLVMSQLYSRIERQNRNGRKVIVSAAQGELHEIGARMVADFFEMEGWDSVYLGANTPARDILTMLKKEPHAVLALSATTTPQLEGVRRLIGAIRAARECVAAHVVVGGYIFNAVQGLWQQIGADGCGRDAKQAIEIAMRLGNE